MSTPANEYDEYDAEIAALNTVIDALWPLDEEARQKVVGAAMAFCQRPTVSEAVAKERQLRGAKS